MNREIKFRAWDKDKEKMVIVNNIKFSEDSVFGNGYLNKEKTLRHYVLMQYTGLKDKNGTEIYEGDIVEFSNGLAIVEDVYSFRETYFQNTLPDGFEIQGGEVVGNIYQNPELLTPQGEEGEE